MTRIVAVTREEVYSPGKVEADAGILRAVADALAAPIDFVRGEEVGGEAPAIALAMCQGPKALSTLARWELAGTRTINSSRAIGLTFSRLRMLETLKRAGVAMPAFRVVPTDDGAPAGWVKRCDVHAEGPGDVSRDPGALENFRRRGIDYAIVQDHVEGREEKYYGVRGRGLVAGPAELAEVAQKAADALGLDVYGGDAIHDGARWLVIDVNDWPSFSSCREPAASAIASLVRSLL